MENTNANQKRYYYDEVGEKFPVFLIALKEYSFPEQVKHRAMELYIQHTRCRELKSELKLVPFQVEMQIINLSDVEHKITELHCTSQKTGDLFNEVRREYISWYHENVPDKIKLAAFPAPVDKNIVDVYHWLAKSRYDYGSHDIISEHCGY